VRFSGFEILEPAPYLESDVVRMDFVHPPPAIDFAQRRAKIFEHPFVDVVEITIRRGSPHQRRNRLHQQTKLLLKQLFADDLPRHCLRHFDHGPDAQSALRSCRSDPVRARSESCRLELGESSVISDSRAGLLGCAYEHERLSNGRTSHERSSLTWRNLIRRGGFCGFYVFVRMTPSGRAQMSKSGEKLRGDRLRALDAERLC
jgi:hypothetical protein